MLPALFPVCRARHADRRPRWRAIWPSCKCAHLSPARNRQPHDVCHTTPRGFNPSKSTWARWTKREVAQIRSVQLTTWKGGPFYTD